MNDKDKLIKNDVRNEFLQEEFADEFFDEKSKVGYAPITGGLITRGLIRIGEEIIADQDKEK